MKRFFGMAATVALMGMAMPAAADALEGMWRTSKDDNGNSGIIKVAPCGSSLCGTLVQSFDSAGKPLKTANIGKQIISATKPTGGGNYKGKVFSPDRGKTYNSKLVLSGNTLKVSGCVLGVCRDGGTWTRQ
ncbi:DUF2147 domain-containing protein [Alphaproteobacteria bacterium KMM 3653]|uniref:DUF2147 domain-containing protein n=1 Tax=Harenicola maris TaxID=2841044 RepID=A0AAP2G6E7_9RHOB|nr:DUF2147 domain-containing protein [Harenicola maris]